MKNINFLRYFYSAAQHQSMSKSAKENFVSQSAISQGIDKLEIELGRKLISNKKNAFELTQDGKILLEKCEQIFALFLDVEDMFNEEEGIYRGKISYASSHSFALSLLPDYYQKLFDLYPDVEPILRLGHAGLVREWVSKGDVELGIILTKESDHLTFQTQTIIEGTYGLYKSEKKEPAKKLFISEGSNEDKLIIQSLREKLPVVEVLSWEVIANMIEQGLGIGILPDYVVRKRGLVRVSLKIPVIPYRIGIIASKKRELSRNAKMFIKLLS